MLGKKFVQTQTIKLGDGDGADDRTVYRLGSITEDVAFVQALVQLAGVA